MYSFGEDDLANFELKRKDSSTSDDESLERRGIYDEVNFDMRRKDNKPPTNDDSDNESVEGGTIQVGQFFPHHPSVDLIDEGGIYEEIAPLKLNYHQVDVNY